MKTVVKINPEEEYEKAKLILETSGVELLDTPSLHSLDSSLENLITVARVLIKFIFLRSLKTRFARATFLNANAKKK